MGPSSRTLTILSSVCLSLRWIQVADYAPRVMPQGQRLWIHFRSTSVICLSSCVSLDDLLHGIGAQRTFWNVP